ncbi:cytochrome c-type biogenesis protein CcmE homolog, mitochondrial [Argentina anserina]|uniref:cytochrome c-type biogenesis protein CcmE homolog, mitochondrial n=1 Tax=Argentina anserina TaxID=57926 RepID=UPI002176755B|nr:cytochrome c-type biogenesis protein CcmE homolog, mitochondrial [Potentilla anserina]
MATRLAFRLKSHLLRRPSSAPSSLIHLRTYSKSPPSIFSSLHHTQPLPPSLRFLSTASRRGPVRPKSVDIGARARQLQARRLWTYALTFSCIAGFIVIVLNSFQDQLVFYVTPTDALDKYNTNPSKSKFRLGGLVLEGSVVQPASSPEIEFVITDLMTDILVRYKGSLPDLFREGHSVVVEGFVKPFTDEIRKEVSTKSVSGKARTGECYFSATEVLAKHDEKYMPGEVAAALEKNKKKLAEEAKSGGEGGADLESNAGEGRADGAAVVKSS